VCGQVVCVSKLCVSKLCVDKLCEDKRRREEADGRRDTEPKTRTPHKDVGKKLKCLMFEKYIQNHRITNNHKYIITNIYIYIIYITQRTISCGRSWEVQSGVSWVRRTPAKLDVKPKVRSRFKHTAVPATQCISTVHNVHNAPFLFFPPFEDSKQTLLLHGHQMETTTNPKKRVLS